LKNKKKQFGNMLKRFRLRKKLTQEKLAEMTGLSNVYISGIERGKHNPSLDTIHSLAVALGIEAGELLGE